MSHQMTKKLVDEFEPIVGLRWIETEWMWLDVPEDSDE